MTPCFSLFCPSFTFLCVTSSFSALAADERNRPLPMKVHSCRPSASHDPQTDLKAKREVRTPSRFSLAVCFYTFSRASFFEMSFLTSSPRRCTQSRGVAATTCRPDPQTATGAISRPSPAPAVPLALVAPATCQSNQKDPEEDSGQSSLAVCPSRSCQYVCMYANPCVSVFLVFFVSACQPLHVSTSPHVCSALFLHTHACTQIRKNVGV